MEPFKVGAPEEFRRWPAGQSRSRNFTTTDGHKYGRRADDLKFGQSFHVPRLHAKDVFSVKEVVSVELVDVRNSTVVDVCTCAAHGAIAGSGGTFRQIFYAAIILRSIVEA
jgi:hypothetical protein